MVSAHCSLPSAYTLIALLVQGCSGALVGLRDRISGSSGITTNTTTAAGGGFAFAPQEPWIQNATVRDNVLFGRPLDTARQVLLNDEYHYHCFT
jgi:hypothetical protein